MFASNQCLAGKVKQKQERKKDARRPACVRVKSEGGGCERGGRRGLQIGAALISFFFLTNYSPMSIVTAEYTLDGFFLLSVQ